MSVNQLKSKITDYKEEIDFKHFRKMSKVLIKEQ